MAVDRHPTKDELLIGGSDGTPRLYRMYRKKKRVIGDDFNLLKAFEALSGRVFAARFNSDGSRIVVASSHQSGGTLRVCDVKTGKTLWTQNAPQGLFAATFDGGDKVIAAGGFDGIVRLHNAASGEVITEFAALPFAAQSTVKATTSSEVIVR
jgi:WD40 repeat protein